VTHQFVAASGGNSLFFIVLLLGLFVVLFVLPNRRRQRAQKQRLQAIEIGAEVLTVGGVIGRVVEVDDGELKLEIADGVVVRLARRGIATVLHPEEPADEEEGVEEEPEEAEPETQESAEDPS
jgi:preprotein translocase subunit YajC